VLAAHAAMPRHTRPRTAAAATAIVLALAGGGVLTRPGQAVGEWVGHKLDVVKEAKPKPAPRPTPVHRDGTALPSPGKLLVSGGRGLWIVNADGSKRRLGTWTQGALSPHALNVAATRGRTLAAIATDGNVRWKHTAPAPVKDPRWSPDGLNIAYRAGARMHLIYGNGLHDVTLHGRAADAAPAWRPNDPNTLAWARQDGTVIVENAYTGLILWHRRTGPVRTLAWSADGKRLLIAGRRRAAIYRPGSTTKPHTIALAPGESLAAAVFAPQGNRLALAIASPDRTRVQLLHRDAALVEAPGRLNQLTWSPDGDWLIAPYRDEWLLVSARGGPQVRSLDGLRMSTRAEGWCCP
jgi:WD40 repeat protein